MGKEGVRQQETTRTRTSASSSDRKTDRIETEEFARVGRRRKTRIMATWKDKLSDREQPSRHGVKMTRTRSNDPSMRSLIIRDTNRCTAWAEARTSRSGRKICDMKVLRSYRGAHLIRTITSSRIRAISTKDCAHLSHRKRASLA